MTQATVTKGEPRDRKDLARVDETGECGRIRAAAEGGDLPRHRRQERPRLQGHPTLPQTLDEEVEFVTIMRFDSWDAVRWFSGEDYERAYVPPKAREVLARFDERSRHYEVRESLEYRP